MPSPRSTTPVRAAASSRHGLAETTDNEVYSCCGRRRAAPLYFTRPSILRLAVRALAPESPDGPWRHGVWNAPWSSSSTTTPSTGPPASARCSAPRKRSRTRFWNRSCRGRPPGAPPSTRCSATGTPVASDSGTALPSAGRTAPPARRPGRSATFSVMRKALTAGRRRRRPRGKRARRDTGPVRQRGARMGPRGLRIGRGSRRPPATVVGETGAARIPRPDQRRRGDGGTRDEGAVPPPPGYLVRLSGR